MIQELSAGDFVDMSIRKRFSSSCEGDRGTLESMRDRTKIKRRWWSCSQQTWLSAFSVFTGIALTALAGVMQTDPYRNWYKGAFRPWGLREYMEYYAAFAWLPLWMPTFAAGVSILFFQKRRRRGGGGKRLEKPYEYLLHSKWLPSATVLEIVAFVLITSAALSWLLLPTRRALIRGHWQWDSLRTWSGIAEAFGQGCVPLLAGLLLPADATESVLTFMNVTPERATGYHRWMGSGAFLLSAMHGVGYLPVLWKSHGGWEGLKLMLFSMATCHAKHKCIPAGLFALVVGLTFAFFARYAQRRVNWRRFRVLHVLGAPLFYLGAAAHWQKLIWYLVPGVALYMAKVAARIHQHCYTFQAAVSIGVSQEEERVLLHFKLPWLDAHSHVGQWVGVGSSAGWFPEIHPATLVTAPGGTSRRKKKNPELALVLNRKSTLAKEVLWKNWRKRDLGDVESSSEGSYWTKCELKVKGPYGGIAPLEADVPTLLVAGGSGITPILALLDQEQGLKHRAHRSVCWALRGSHIGCSLLKAMSPHLNDLEGVSTRIYATGESWEDLEKVYTQEDSCGPQLNPTGKLTARFANCFECLPPPPEVTPALFPIAAACGGMILGLYSMNHLEDYFITRQQGWLIPVAGLSIGCLSALFFALFCTLPLHLFPTYSEERYGGERSELLPGHIRSDESSEDLSPDSLLSKTSSVSFQEGRPDLRAIVTNFVSEWKGKKDVLVVVAGPEGLVKSVKSHPSHFRLRDCSFVL